MKTLSFLIFSFFLICSCSSREDKLLNRIKIHVDRQQYNLARTLLDVYGNKVKSAEGKKEYRALYDKCTTQITLIDSISNLTESLLLSGQNKQAFMVLQKSLASFPYEKRLLNKIQGIDTNKAPIFRYRWVKSTITYNDYSSYDTKVVIRCDFLSHWKNDQLHLDTVRIKVNNLSKANAVVIGEFIPKFKYLNFQKETGYLLMPDPRRSKDTYKMVWAGDSALGYFSPDKAIIANEGCKFTFDEIFTKIVFKSDSHCFLEKSRFALDDSIYLVGYR